MKRFALLLVFVLWPQAVSPQLSPHGELSPGLDCGACHDAAGWTPLRRDLQFDHARDAGFELNGRHAQVSCVGCHARLRFDIPRAAPEQCAQCHADPHRGRLSRDCASCHDTRSFTSARSARTHERSTFPLVGAHRVIACESCHRNEAGGAFTPLDARCVACHRADLARARFPDHSAPVFQNACETCHRSQGWQGARFDHASVSGFELVGAHRRAECTACHAPPDFRPRFNPASAEDCVACHRADYDREHAGTGFPLDCASCHSTERWTGATFDHDFPIFRGAHAGEWNDCRDCHTTPGNFQAFTCLTCHTRGDTDDEHDEVPNYAYESTRCLACHPNGEED